MVAPERVTPLSVDAKPFQRCSPPVDQRDTRQTSPAKLIAGRSISLPDQTLSCR